MNTKKEYIPLERSLKEASEVVIMEKEKKKEGKILGYNKNVKEAIRKRRKKCREWKLENTRN